jgi:hypothetical protein
MVTEVRTHAAQRAPARPPRVRMLILAALLALCLSAGLARSRTTVDAHAAQRAPVQSDIMVCVIRHGHTICFFRPYVLASDGGSGLADGNDNSRADASAPVHQVTATDSISVATTPQIARCHLPGSRRCGSW